MKIITLFFMLLSVAPTLAAPASQEDIKRCAPDVHKFCQPQIDAHDLKGAGECMWAHRDDLSKPCRAVFNRIQEQAKRKNKKRPTIAVRVPVEVPLPKPQPEEKQSTPAPVPAPAVEKPIPAIESPPAPAPPIEPGPVIAPPAPEPASVPVVQPKPEGAKPVETITNNVPWNELRIAAAVIVALLLFYGVKNYGPAAWAGIKSAASKVTGAAATAEKNVAGLVPALRADFAKLDARVKAVEAKLGLQPPA